MHLWLYLSIHRGTLKTWDKHDYSLNQNIVLRVCVTQAGIKFRSSSNPLALAPKRLKLLTLCCILIVNHWIWPVLFWDWSSLIPVVQVHQACSVALISPLFCEWHLDRLRAHPHPCHAHTQFYKWYSQRGWLGLFPAHLWAIRNKSSGQQS